MDIISLLILTFVEGFTEFLPVSSTGHLIIVSHFLGISGEFSTSFNIAVQLGAILAIVFLYWRSLFLSREIILRVVIAFLPTAVIGFLFYSFITEYLLGNSAMVAWMFIVGGAILILFELWHKENNENFKEIENLPYSKALIIGLFQSVSLIPGVSRSAATIVGGLFSGLKRKATLEFSFLLAVPTMAAATGLDLFKNYHDFDSGEVGTILLGMILSFVFAYLSVKFLLFFINHFTFIPFGVYRIILGVVLLLWLI